MRTRRFVSIGLPFVLASAAFAVACVSSESSLDDAGVTSGGDGAADVTTANGDATTDTGSPTDAGADSALPFFDASNPTCNGLTPFGVPHSTTTECTMGAPPLGSGGTIKEGKYYLADELFYNANCADAGKVAPYRDEIEITKAADGGFTVQAATEFPNASRFTLAWAVGASTFTQYDVCPADSFSATGIGYTVQSDGTLVYTLPGYGTLTFKPIP